MTLPGEMRTSIFVDRNDDGRLQYAAGCEFCLHRGEYHVAEPRDSNAVDVRRQAELDALKHIRDTHPERII